MWKHVLWNDLFLFFRLVGDALIGTAFLSYLGPFNQEFRKKLEKHFQKELTKRRIPYNSNLDIPSLLADSATVSLKNNFYIYIYILI